MKWHEAVIILKRYGPLAFISTSYRKKVRPAGIFYHRTMKCHFIVTVEEDAYAGQAELQLPLDHGDLVL